MTLHSFTTISKSIILFPPIEPKILVALVSFGKLSTHDICHILSLLNVDYRILLPHEIPSFHFTHIILSGSSRNFHSPTYPLLPRWVINSSSPVLGICYGMHLIAHTFGAILSPMSQSEIGTINVTEIIQGIYPKQRTQSRWMHRHNQVISVPPIFHVTAVTENNHIAAFTDYKKWWAVQYHPESSKHRNIRLFKSFLFT